MAKKKNYLDPTFDEELGLFNVKMLNTAELKFHIDAVWSDCQASRFVGNLAEHVGQQMADVLTDNDPEEEEEAEKYRERAKMLGEWLKLAEAELETRPDKDTAMLVIEVNEKPKKKSKKKNS